MGFPSYTFNVMVASPSDLSEEREVAVAAIHEWNDLNAEAEGITLLPLLWEKHATPEVGKHPQEIINDQLVAKADLMIGLFWTKAGTTTGRAESGTIEEIQKMIRDGKQVMLYFSNRKLSPSQYDPKQMKRLKESKADIFKTALCGKFESNDELCRKVVGDLTRRVRTMKAALPKEVDQKHSSGGGDLEVKIHCVKGAEPYMRWLTIDIHNRGIELNDLGALLRYPVQNELFNFHVGPPNGEIPNPFKTGYSCRFIARNGDPTRRVTIWDALPLDQINIVILSSAREVMKIPATEWQEALEDFRKADPSLPPPPQAAPIVTHQNQSEMLRRSWLAGKPKW